MDHEQARFIDNDASTNTRSSPVQAPVEPSEASTVPVMEPLSSLSPQISDLIATLREITPNSDETARTPTSKVLLTGLAGGKHSRSGSAITAFDYNRSNYHTSKSTLRGSSSTMLPVYSSASNESSYLHSAYASSASLQSSMADNGSAEGYNERLR